MTILGRPDGVEGELIQVRRLLLGDLVQAKVAQDEQIGCEGGPESPIQGVVHSGLGHGLEQIVGVDEAYGVSGADGRVAQGPGEETLAHASRSPQGTCSCLSRNSREKTASSSRRCGVIDADQSKSSRRQVSSKPAPFSRISMPR